jgi:hypothetical protein
MIILTLGGGLGNQMFQYAFARKLQKELKDDQLKFSNCHLPKGGDAERSLFHLNIVPGIEFCDEKEQEQVISFQEKRLRNVRVFHRLSKIFPGLAGRYIERASRQGFYTAENIYFKQKYHLTHKNMKYVVGGFQTPLYWEDMQEQIRRELKVKEEPSEANRKMMEEMEQCESVCVHVRRGDYLAPEFAHLNICDEAYYLKAMKSLQDQKKDAVFYIFTNTHEEIEWIRNNYHLDGFDVRYVDMNNPDYEELRLMYSCRNFIISNSTFSWWGQFLSEAENKIVIAPSIWNRETPVDGIYMKDWQLIQIDE